jgi:hypothetical protein
MGRARPRGGWLTMGRAAACTHAGRWKPRAWNAPPDMARIWSFKAGRTGRDHGHQAVRCEGSGWPAASAAPRLPGQAWSPLTRRIGSRPGGWLGRGRGEIAGTGHSCAFSAASFTRLPWWMMSSDPPSSSR